MTHDDDARTIAIIAFRLPESGDDYVRRLLDFEGELEAELALQGMVLDGNEVGDGFYKMFVECEDVQSLLHAVRSVFAEMEILPGSFVREIVDGAVRDLPLRPPEVH